ncbi:MAG TPA: hypothetical protein VIJ57_05005 [Hanamia sp.]
MAKLVRYNSFEALKLEDKSTNEKSSKSTQRNEEMVNFVDLLRQKFVEKKEIPREDLKIS